MIKPKISSRNIKSLPSRVSSKMNNSEMGKPHPPFLTGKLAIYIMANLLTKKSKKTGCKVYQTL